MKVLRPLYATSNNEEIAMKMKKLVIEPFAFDEGIRNEPTEFELFFRTELAEYRYELTVKKEVVQDVLDWFAEEIDFLNYGNPMQELRMAVSKSEDVKRLMLQMIQEMDLDIVDFRVKEKENDSIEVFTKHVVDEFEAELNLFDESIAVLLISANTTCTKPPSAIICAYSFR